MSEEIAQLKADLIDTSAASAFWARKAKELLDQLEHREKELDMLHDWLDAILQIYQDPGAGASAFGHVVQRVAEQYKSFRYGE